jgi:hypothetical protein
MKPLLYFFLVPFVNIYLLDTVTGSLKLSHTHKRVKSPIHVVLAENWIVVSLNKLVFVKGKLLFESYSIHIIINVIVDMKLLVHHYLKVKHNIIIQHFHHLIQLNLLYNRKHIYYHMVLMLFK